MRDEKGTPVYTSMATEASTPIRPITAPAPAPFSENMERAPKLAALFEVFDASAAELERVAVPEPEPEPECEPDEPEVPVAELPDAVPVAEPEPDAKNAEAEA